PRRRVIRVNLAAPDLARAETVVAAGPVVAELAAAGDALYVRLLDGGIGRVLRVPYAGAGVRALSLPFAGAVSELCVDGAAPGARFRLESWTRPARLYRFDPAQPETVEERLGPADDADPSLQSLEVAVPSADGTLVPLSIVLRRDDNRRPH